MWANYIFFRKQLWSPEKWLGITDVVNEQELPAQALEGLFVRGLEELLHTFVHYPGCQHFKLVQLADEADVTEGTATRSHLLFLPFGLNK